MTISKGKPGRPKGYSPKLGRFLTAKELARKTGKPVTRTLTGKLKSAKPSKVVTRKIKPIGLNEHFNVLTNAILENNKLLKESNQLTKQALGMGMTNRKNPVPEANPETEVDPWLGTADDTKDPIAPNDDVASIMNS